MPTGTLTIFRPDQYADRARKYRLLLDDQEVGRIEHGNILRISVPEGEHQLVAKIDWARSNPLSISIRAGEVTDVEVGSNVTGWKLLAVIYFITLGASRYLYLRPNVPEPSFLSRGPAAR